MPRSSVYATVENGSVAETLQQAAAAGKVTFHIRRSDGSLRRMAYLPPGSAARRVAERVDKARQSNVPMKDIAAKLHVSVPTVRRIINNLELSRRVEAGDMSYALELVEKEEPASFQRKRGEGSVPAPRDPST